MRKRNAWIQAAIVLAVYAAGGTRPLASRPPDPLPLPARVLSDAAPRVAALPFTQPPVIRDEPVSPTALSFQQLEQLAAAHNPTLAQAARRVEALEGQQVQVGLYPNPVVGYMSEEMGEEGQAGQHGVYLRQELVTANKLGWNRAVASQEVLQARWEMQVQQWRVTNSVRIQAFEVLAAQRTVEVTEELVAIGRAAVDAAERLFQARQVSQVDVLQARVEANSAQLHLIAARKTYDAAWRRLAIVIGTPDMKPAPLENRLDDELPDIAWSDSVQHLRNESPEIAAARAGVERARNAVARACAGRTPNIETGAAVRHNDVSEDTTVSLQIGVPLMIFDRNQGNIMSAQAELREAQQNLERVDLQLQDRMAEVFREYEIAREQVAQYRQAILPDARKSLELTRAGYQQNEFGYLELLTAQQTFTRTNLAYIGALRELWLSITKIDGMLLTGGLNAPS